MTFLTETLATPIRFNDEGVAMIGTSRVLLASVIAAFHAGDSPEQIVASYDTLSLAEVYATLAYYLHYRETIDAYLAQSRVEAFALRQQLEHEQASMFTLQARLYTAKHST